MYIEINQEKREGEMLKIQLEISGMLRIALKQVTPSQTKC